MMANPLNSTAAASPLTPRSGSSFGDQAAQPEARKSGATEQSVTSGTDAGTNTDRIRGQAPDRSGMKPSAPLATGASTPEATTPRPGGRSGDQAAPSQAPKSLPGATERPGTPGTNADTNTDRIRGQGPDRSGMKPSAPLATGTATPEATAPRPLAPAALESGVNAAVADAVSGSVPPATGTDFSTATPEELGDAAANAAEDIGRILATGGGKADIAAPQGTLAAARTALADQGASEEQLQTFDASVSVLAIQSGLTSIDSPLADSKVREQSRFTLQATTLDAFDGAKQGDNPGINGTLADLMNEVRFGRIPPATDIDTAALTGEEIGAQLGNIAIALGKTSTSSNPGEAGEQARTEAAGRYAALRDQLDEDGATGLELRALDAYVIDLATEAALSGPGASASDGSAIDRQDAAFGKVDNQIAAIARTRLVRESRQDPDSLIDEVSAREAADFVGKALRNDATESGVNLSVASVDELTDGLNFATDRFVQGEIEGGARGFSRKQRAQDIFDQVRDEILTRTTATELSDDIGNIIEERAALLLSDARQPSVAKQERAAELGDALRFAVAADLLVDGTAGVQNVIEFEGTNGKPPADIFTFEPKPVGFLNNPDSEEAPATVIGSHNAVVTNVITDQLEAAGQGFRLVETQYGLRYEGTDQPGEIAVLRNDVSFGLAPAVQRAEETGGPVYANMSYGVSREPDFYQRGLEALEGFDLVEGLDLSVDISQGNIGDYADAIRAVAFASRERPDVAEALGEDVKQWRGMARDLEALETAAEAGVHIFIAVPNSDTVMSDFQFAQDDGAKGSITYVANDADATPLEGSRFVLPGQGEEPTTLVPGENIDPDDVDNFYRGEGVDVYAPGTVYGNNRGSSFAAPEMLVNAVLGIFDPQTETRIGSA